MLYNMLAAADKTRTVEIPEAALYALLGFSVVFVGIIFLIAVVWLVGKIMSRGKSKASPKQVEKPVAPSAPQSQPQAVPVVDDDVDEETVAVIMAAIVAYYETNYPKCEFTVKRIKRI